MILFFFFLYNTLCPCAEVLRSFEGRVFSLQRRQEVQTRGRERSRHPKKRNVLDRGSIVREQKRVLCSVKLNHNNNNNNHHQRRQGKTKKKKKLTETNHPLTRRNTASDRAARPLKSTAWNADCRRSRDPKAGRADRGVAC